MPMVNITGLQRHQERGLNVSGFYPGHHRTVTSVMSVIIKSFLSNSRYCMSYCLNRINNILNGFCTAKYWSEEHIKVNLYVAARPVYTVVTCFQSDFYISEILFLNFQTVRMTDDVIQQFSKHLKSVPSL